MPSSFNVAGWSPDNKLMAFLSTESGHPKGYLGLYQSSRLEGIIPVSKGITEYLVWSEVDGAPLKIHYISDFQEFTRTVAVENDRIKLASPVATGRVMSTENLDNAISMDLSGRLYVNRKGGNERPASNVQMITNLESRLK